MAVKEIERDNLVLGDASSVVTEVMNRYQAGEDLSIGDVVVLTDAENAYRIVSDSSSDNAFGVVAEPCKSGDVPKIFYGYSLREDALNFADVSDASMNTVRDNVYANTGTIIMKGVN